MPCLPSSRLSSTLSPVPLLNRPLASWPYLDRKSTCLTVRGQDLHHHRDLARVVAEALHHELLGDQERDAAQECGATTTAGIVAGRGPATRGAGRAPDRAPRQRQPAGRALRQGAQ